MQRLNFTLCLLFIVSMSTVCAGISCYQGTPIERISVYCAGSCLTLKKKDSFYYCSPIKLATGCQTFNGTEAYFCNTDHCNHEDHFPCPSLGRSQGNQVETMEIPYVN